MNGLSQKELAAKDKICLGLDLQDKENILKTVQKLSPYIGYFKLNFAFTRFGPELVRKIQSYGSKVFLDLKLHDTPNTVAGYAKSLCELGVDIVTVHIEGGTEMLKELIKAAKECEEATGQKRPKFIGVTLLTSIDQEILQSELNIHDKIETEILRRAKIGIESGLDGIVCSAMDLPAIKNHLPKQIIYVTPAISANPVSLTGQKRATTCKEAIDAGSSLMVFARELLHAEDQVAYSKSILNQVANKT